MYLAPLIAIVLLATLARIYIFRDWCFPPLNSGVCFMCSLLCTYVQNHIPLSLLRGDAYSILPFLWGSTEDDWVLSRLRCYRTRRTTSVVTNLSHLTVAFFHCVLYVNTMTVTSPSKPVVKTGGAIRWQSKNTRGIWCHSSLLNRRVCFLYTFSLTFNVQF